jgi:dihydrofolate reductase
MRTYVYVGTSLDGFIARNDGDIEWLSRFADDQAIDAYHEFTAGIDGILIGRGTFEKVLTFSSWPYNKPVFVLSRTIGKLPDSLEDSAEILDLPPRGILDRLSDKGFKNIYVDGGQVIQDFLREDLIDELIVAKVPVLIGSGIPLFSSLDIDLSFAHLKTTIAKNGLVRSYYTRC